MSHYIEIPRRTRSPRIYFAFAMMAILAVLFFMGAFSFLSWESIRDNLQSWQATTRANLPLALGIFLFVYILIVSLSIPIASPLSLLAGALFGRWLGTAVVSLGSTTGACVAFLLSRYFFRNALTSRLGDRGLAMLDGIEKKGRYYLFALRLVPVFPFFLVNIGMGLTRISLFAFAVISWIGMLPGTFLYVNAGTALGAIDEPKDLLAPSTIVALAAIGLVPLVLRWLLWRGTTRREVLKVIGIAVVVVAVAMGIRIALRYSTAPEMLVPIREFSNAEYPEDPALRSVHHGRYNGRSLNLVQRDATHFDFVFTGKDAHLARIAFRNIDVSLMTPSLPEWAKADAGVRRIALTDRQWNRQQVRFEPAEIEIDGGDGFEKSVLVSAELAKNCLNAGLWELLLFTKEGGEKTLYYQGWFTFPLGQYRKLFEQNTGLPYWQHAYYLEHWFDPAGTPIPAEALRTVVYERTVPTAYDPHERIISGGEQNRKRRTTMAENVVDWGDFTGPKKIRFAAFIPPGRYSVTNPWKNEYRRLDTFRDAVLRDVTCPGSIKPLHELELRFDSSVRSGVCRFIVGGFDADALPILATSDYAKGLYRPMGIGVPPFFQTYRETQANPPHLDPFYCNLLDENDRWIDHHTFGIDGPVMHRDAANPRRIHIYMLSYERHALIGHWVVDW